MNNLLLDPKMSARWQVLAHVWLGVLHDLNNPLGAALNFAQVLQRDINDAEDEIDLTVMKENADDIVESVKRCRELTRALHFFVKGPHEKHCTMQSIWDTVSLLLAGVARARLVKCHFAAPVVVGSHGENHENQKQYVTHIAGLAFAATTLQMLVNIVSAQTNPSHGQYAVTITPKIPEKSEDGVLHVVIAPTYQIEISGQQIDNVVDVALIHGYRTQVSVRDVVVLQFFPTDQINIVPE